MFLYDGGELLAINVILVIVQIGAHSRENKNSKANPLPTTKFMLDKVVRPFSHEAVTTDSFVTEDTY